MALLSYAGVGLWTVQMIFSGVVMAISASMATAQKYGRPPVATQYSIFAGAFGLVVGIVGLASMFFDKIPGTSVLAADGLVGLFLFAAGLAFSIDLSGANCGAYDRNDLLEYNLLNEGRRGPYYGVFRDGADGSRLIKNCRLARASQGLQLAACALAILTMVVTFKLWRAGRVGPLPRAR